MSRYLKRVKAGRLTVSPILSLLTLALLLGACTFGGEAGVAEFGSDPATINAGESARLYWRGLEAGSRAAGAVFGGGAGVSLGIEPGVGDVTGKDSVTVSPTQTTTYTLTVSSAAGESSYQTTVEVARADAAPALGGDLEVTVSGLPDVVGADVVVKGPEDFSRILTGTARLTDLRPGEYTVTGSSVMSGATTYIAAVSTSPVSVAAGETASVSVSYVEQDPATGSLEVAVDGLPTSVEAGVTVTGPDGFRQALTTSRTLASLAPGDYTITATSVTSTYTYTASVTTSPAAVTAGGVTRAAVTYSATTGALAVSVSGLPQGTDADVTVTGPDSFSRSLTESGTLSDLAPGDYPVAASDVTVGGNTYTATVTSSPVNVAEGVTADVVVRYAPVPGSLQIDISGLPDGADADVTVSSANGFSRTLTASGTLSVDPGEYTVTANDVSASYNYTATVTGSPAAVTANTTTVVTVGYSATTGDLEVTISGLPNGADADVSVTGPGGFSQTLAGSQTLTGLTLGQYTVTGNSVTVGDDTYTATVSNSPASVSGAMVTSASVSYSPERLWVPTLGTPDILGYASDQLASSGSPAPDVTLSGFDSTDGQQTAVAFDGDGNLWTTDWNGNTISKIAAADLAATGTPTASVTISSDSSGSLYNPISLAFDNSGNLWVANYNWSTGTLEKYTPDQLTTTGSPTPDVTISGVQGPTGLAFDASGNLWVANFNGGSSATLAKYTPDQLTTTGSPAPSVTISGSSSRMSLAFDSSGNLWASTYGNTIVKYTPAQLATTGSPTPDVTISADGSGSLSSTHGLAFNSDGSLWVSNGGNATLVKYTLAQLAVTGNPTPDVTISGLPAQPGYSHMAFYPVPPNLPINTP